jgi:hypothetical protein|tara:strand:- start:1602 stop:1709 length:108 start_codon:yes stop_codon:yes gene_type:complete
MQAFYINLRQEKTPPCFGGGVVVFSLSLTLGGSLA